MFDKFRLLCIENYSSDLISFSRLLFLFEDEIPEPEFTDLSLSLFESSFCDRIAY